VTVTHRGRTVVLRAPGEGTDFPGTTSPPSRMQHWTQPKIARAIATISFR
jgi:hypothetical protein